MDTRPLEDPARAPTTALYLGELLSAYDAEPIEGESFAFLVGLRRPDPTEGFANLEVAARRRMPPSQLLRSGALTVDPFLLRGASIGSAWWAEQGGAAGAVFHTAAGAIPIGSRLPVVVTLLDLAPWELPAVYQRSPAAAFGQRLRGRILRGAAAVIVGSEATARAVLNLLHVRPERIVVVPLAARAAFQPAEAGRGGRSSTRRAGSPATSADPRSDRERLGLSGGYLVYSGRYDARQDLGSLIGALSRLAADIQRPYAVVLGGAKVADKIGALLDRADQIFVGGAVAFTFLAAQGHPVGASLVERDQLDAVRGYLDRARCQETRVGRARIVLPPDIVAAPARAPGALRKVVPAGQIPTDWMGLDIRPEAAWLFAAQLAGAKTIFWNGPMGVFELEPFAAGTRTVAGALIDSGAFTVIGGGDTAAAVRALGFADSAFGYVSTGGGASLDYLQGKDLPGLDALAGIAVARV